MTARRTLVVALATVGTLAPLVLFGARYPRWWVWIAPEETPMTWLQSVVLVLAAATSALVAFVLRSVGDRPAHRRAWWLLSAGFAALAVDERFALHERVRDRVLAPRGTTIPFLPWVAPGDFLVMAVAVVGLAVLPMVWRASSVDAGARRALLLGVGLAVVAVGLDSIDPSTWTVQAERVQQSIEEVIELASGLAFLAVAGLRLLGLLEQHLRPVPPAPLDLPVVERARIPTPV